MGDGAKNLVEQSFWERTYLADTSLPARPSPNMPFENMLMQELSSRAPGRMGERVLEVGCAPGRWMTFYAERFGCSVEGIEYTLLGAELTRANLQACDVEGVVHEGDFWDFVPPEPYDLVVSLGFIEHFSDIDLAFARHADLVRPGGRLVIGVPNFQGLVAWLQRRFDADWLALVNPDAMGRDGYKRRALANGLEVESLAYVGGFDPDLISTRWAGRRIVGPVWRLRHAGVGRRPNAWWLSTYLLGVYDRPGEFAS